MSPAKRARRRAPYGNFPRKGSGKEGEGERECRARWPKFSHFLSFPHNSCENISIYYFTAPRLIFFHGHMCGRVCGWAEAKRALGPFIFLSSPYHLCPLEPFFLALSRSENSFSLVLFLPHCSSLFYVVGLLVFLWDLYARVPRFFFFLHAPTRMNRNVNVFVFDLACGPRLRARIFMRFASMKYSNGGLFTFVRVFCNVCIRRGLRDTENIGTIWQVKIKLALRNISSLAYCNTS